VGGPHAGLTDDEEDELTSSVKRLLNDALERAEESPQPDPATLAEGVFASPEDLDTPHHK
jgi:TPP-dependent pyruvate/acetoin dehydrogenase alpha subunit